MLNVKQQFLNLKCNQDVECKTAELVLVLTSPPSEWAGECVQQNVQNNLVPLLRPPATWMVGLICVLCAKCLRTGAPLFGCWTSDEY